MKTLVYFASGEPKQFYKELDYDEIYLVDYCFEKGENRWAESDKVILLGMDCLEAVDWLKNKGVQVDCFVSLNEGLVDGGGKYAIHGDPFFGYAMQIMKGEYLHIMNPNYYGVFFCLNPYHRFRNRITMD